MRISRLALLLLAACAPRAAAQDKRPPNIIFVLADDLGYGDLGCYGQKRIKTPNLDRMAAEGVRFTQFYAGSTVCAPSRCVLMTGRHVGHAYIRGNSKANLRPEDVTVAEVMKKAGYATGLCGKWGLGHEGSSGVPTRKGFDFFFGYLDQTHAHNYYPTFLLRNEERVKLPNVVPKEGPVGQGVASKKVEYSHDHIAREALAFVDRNKDKPFFLYYAMTLPHANNEAGKEGMEIPDLGEYKDLDWPEPQKGHAAMISRLDHDVGELLKRLKQHGIDENTVVLFSSDNGPHKEGGADADFNDSNGPLRGTKRDLTEGGIRVPMIVRWPGKAPAGAVSDHAGYFGDFQATAAEIGGAPTPGAHDGISFLPAILGKEQRKHEHLYWEFYERGSAQAVRMGDWKGVAKPFWGDLELYDLKSDLGEAQNVAAKHPEIVEKIRAIMKKEHVPSPDWKVPPGKKGLAPERKPNVLLVVADDMGWGDVRSHGNAQIDTPVLDRLASEGARFDRFFVSPVCAPTRASLLTGRYSLRTGVSGVTRGLETMRAEELTLAEALRAAGYATGAFGKWHNGAHWPEHPNAQGFDEFFGFCGGHWNNYFDTTLDRNGRSEATKGFITDVLTDEALRFIERNRERPFLCYVPFNAPHGPFQVPDRFFDRHKARGLGDQLSAIYGMVENVDEKVGRLLRKLDELGLAQDTIVLFLTDNGPNSDRYNGGMRGRKGSVHEGGIRVPLFVRWPGKIRPSKIEPIAAHIDLYPTLLDLCGVKPPEGPAIDGVSLAALLRGEIAALPDRILFVHHAGAGNVAPAPGSARTQRFRYVREGKGEALYDMEADPAETKDVSAAHAALFVGLRTAYDAWFMNVTRRRPERPVIAVGHERAPEVELPAPEAYLDGGLHWKGKSGWCNDWITGWTSTDGRAAWELDVVRAGRYEVTLLHTAAEPGAKLRVEAAGASVEGSIAKAHDPAPLPSPDRVPRGEVYEKAWARLALGPLEIPAGRTRLVVRVLEKPGPDLKAVRLVRLD